MKRFLVLGTALCLMVAMSVTSSIASEFKTKEQILQSLVGKTIKTGSWTEQILSDGVSKVNYDGRKFDGAWTIENQGDKAVMCFTYVKSRDANGCYTISIEGNSVSWHSVNSGAVIHKTTILPSS